VLLSSGVGIPLAFISSVILARYLTVEERGEYAVVVSVAFTLTLLVQFGWPTALVARMRGAGTPPALLMTIAVVGSVLFYLPGAAIVSALAPTISEHLLSNASVDLVYLAIGMTFFQTVGLSLSAIAHGIDRFDLPAWYQTSARIGIAAGLFLVLVTAGRGLTEALTVVLIVRLASVLGLFLVLVRHTGLAPKIDRTELRGCLRIGVRTYAQNTAIHLHERLDVLMLAYLAPSSDVAFYAVALALIERLKMVPNAIGSALLPQVTGLERREGASFTARVSRHSALWLTLLVIVLVPAAFVLVPLVYGDRYTPAVDAAVILLVAMGFQSLYRVYAPYFVSVDRQGVNIIGQSSALVLNVGLNLLLIPVYGFRGAAFASLCSYSVAFVYALAAFRSYSGISFRESLVFRSSDAKSYRGWLARALEARRTGTC
jgi:O-antigen/teichoic acid export membrane protein